MYQKKIIILILAIGLLMIFDQKAHAQNELLAPLGPHCGRGGIPLSDPTICGCTWGAVYYRGQPVAGALVTLQFSTQVTQTLTEKQDAELFPYYVTSGAALGAKRDDIMTATVEFAGQTATRAFRAQPDHEGEQQITLVLPEQGVWTPRDMVGYTRTLAINGQKLWAGGPAGLLAVNLSTGVTATQTLDWTDPAVVAVASNHDQVWAMGSHQLAELDDGRWQNRPLPFSATLRALAVHPATSALWLGGGDNAGALAVYDGAWHPITTVNERVTTLTIDDANNVWVGTSGGGLYRHAGDVTDLNSGWTQFKVNDGLASNYILAAATRGNESWFGTLPSYEGDQNYRGGISRYNRADNSWRTYTTANGLPADPLLGQATAASFALAIDAQGTPWAGTGNGIYRLATADAWAIHEDTGNDTVRALVANGNTLMAARARGQLDQLNPNSTSGQPPTAQIATVTAPTLLSQMALTLHATAFDQDNQAEPSQSQILAWDWRSDRDGPLCTTAGTCHVAQGQLSVGVHTISLRVQDDEGSWSQPVTTQITVQAGSQVYLPFVQVSQIVQD
ncbi:MAG: hypothetical protein NT075_21280 [Chloroflexi bacterium]|nr:hypothetical protein [Chloroflexota bacterium]